MVAHLVGDHVGLGEIARGVATSVLPRILATNCPISSAGARFGSRNPTDLAVPYGRVMRSFESRSLVRVCASCVLRLQGA